MGCSSVDAGTGRIKKHVEKKRGGVDGVRNVRVTPAMESMKKGGDGGRKRRERRIPGGKDRGDHVSQIFVKDNAWNHNDGFQVKNKTFGARALREHKERGDAQKRFGVTKVRGWE